jgi:hypothetical protein
MCNYLRFKLTLTQLILGKTPYGGDKERIRKFQLKKSRPDERYRRGRGMKLRRTLQK